jgi:thiamine pyrophosphokinase
MHITIIAGGRWESGDGWQPWIRDADLVIGADGGGARALSWKLIPDLVIGDMDSLPDEARVVLAGGGCRFIEHPRAKDETDLELALTYAAKRGAREITILGAMGGRLDHTLANVLLLTLPELRAVLVRLVDGEEEVFVARRDQPVTVGGEPGDLVSLLPLGGNVDGVTTTGLAWALDGDTLRFGLSRGVSNEMVGSTAGVEVESGYLLVVHGPAAED